MAAQLAAGCGESSSVSPAWSNISAGLIPDRFEGQIVCLAYDKAHDILFAGCGEGGVLRCSSPGSNPKWTEMTGGGPVDCTRALCCDETNNVLFAAGASGVFYWTGGETTGEWKNTNGVGSNFCLAYDADRDVLYSGTQAGLYECVNPLSGPSWSEVKGGPGGAMTTSLLYDSSRKVLFVANDSRGRGVWRYENGTWTDIGRIPGGGSATGGEGGLAYDRIRDILYHPAIDRPRADRAPRTGVARCEKAVTVPGWSSLGGEDSYYFSPVAYDRSSDVLYAGAFVPEPVPLMSERRPEYNKKSHGLFAISDPGGHPKWMNTGGPVEKQDVSGIAIDEQRHLAYVASFNSVWRYGPR